MMIFQGLYIILLIYYYIKSY